MEETARKFLHAHGVARAASSPKTLDEARMLEENERQCEAISSTWILFYAPSYLSSSLIRAQIVPLNL